MSRARAAEGLTQSELALRMGTTQSSVARLESGKSNPTVATVEKALRACGHSLDPRATAFKNSVDETQITEALKATPAERLAHHHEGRKSIVRMVREARPVTSRS